MAWARRRVGRARRAREQHRVAERTALFMFRLDQSLGISESTFKFRQGRESYCKANCLKANSPSTLLKREPTFRRITARPFFSMEPSIEPASCAKTILICGPLIV